MIISEQERQDFVQQCRDDPVFFVEHMLYDERGNFYELEPVQKKFLRCPSPYRLLFLARRLGKSFTMKVDMLHHMLFEPNYKAFGVLPSWNQAHQFSEDIEDIVKRSDLVYSFFERISAEKMRLRNGSRFHVASGGNSGRSEVGAGVNYIAFDEAQLIQDKVYGFLTPIVRGQKYGGARISMAGTPLGRIGRFYETYEDSKYYIKKDGIYENTKKDIFGDFIVFEQQTAYLNDQEEIIESGTPRISLDELRVDRHGMNEIEFKREYCLQWLESIGEVFPASLLQKVVNHDLEAQKESDGEIVMGMDIGKYRNNSVLTIGELDGDDHMNIIYVESFPLETDYYEIAEYLVGLQHRYPNALELLIDETGVGAGVLEIFQNELSDWKNLEVNGFNFAGRNKKKSLVESGLLQLEQGKASLLFNERQYAELLAFRREFTKNNNVKYVKSQGGSDDYVDSLLLCLECGRDWLGCDSFEPDLIDTGMSIFGEMRNNLCDIRGIL